MGDISVYINEVEYPGQPIHCETIVKLDARQIERVFGNFFSNAIKYTRNEIRVTVEDSNAGIYCAVSDNGVGIPYDYHSGLFEAGFQVPGQEKKHSSGIGLNSVKRIIELHGGSVGVESEQGKGSTFYFIIPKS